MRLKIYQAKLSNPFGGCESLREISLPISTSEKSLEINSNVIINWF